MLVKNNQKGAIVSPSSWIKPKMRRLAKYGRPRRLLGSRTVWRKKIIYWGLTKIAYRMKRMFLRRAACCRKILGWRSWTFLRTGLTRAGTAAVT